MNEWIIKDRRNPDFVLHPTTEMVLLKLQSLQSQSFKAILDMGCGSGILSLAAAELWPEAHIMAVDISPAAVEDTQTNILHNNPNASISVVRSDGYSAKEIAGYAPYDLIISNLTADLQVRLARDIKQHIREGGYVIISGVLAWLDSQTAQSLQSLGFTCVDSVELNQWRTSVWFYK